MRENLKWRDDRHPDLWLYPSAGSIFKKIEGVGAGRLIDQCGLKGHIIGNAQFFHIHANIIVNLGGATAADVRALIDLAQETVRRELGYELTPEIGMVGPLGVGGYSNAGLSPVFKMLQHDAASRRADGQHGEEQEREQGQDPLTTASTTFTVIRPMTPVRCP
jgi:hypothetical protein